MTQCLAGNSKCLPYSRLRIASRNYSEIGACGWAADLDAVHQLGHVARHINQNVALRPLYEVAGAPKAQLCMQDKSMSNQLH